MEENNSYGNYREFEAIKIPKKDVGAFVVVGRRNEADERSQNGGPKMIRVPDRIDPAAVLKNVDM